LTGRYDGSRQPTTFVDLVEKTTSYDAATSGSPVNQIQYEYNGFNQPIKEYQEHASAVNTGTSLKVQYAYLNGSTNSIRRTSLTYPDGRVLTFKYNSGHDDELSRVSYLEDNDVGLTHLAEYTYLGLVDVVKVDYKQPQLLYDLATGSGATTYAGLDRFDRTMTCLWQRYGGGAGDRVKLGYTYDRLGNRLTREDFVAKAQTTPQYFDELYTYDGLYRLIDLKRGQLSTGAITNQKFRQNWQTTSAPIQSALDPTGNWSKFNQDDNGDGTWELTQARTHNVVNELTGYTSGAWATPAYDAAGNTTTISQVALPTSSYACQYDAWNRLVKVVEGATTRGQYVYDGLHRRVRKTTNSGDNRDFYYSGQWQNLEERTTAAPTQVERQYVWGLRYIDDLVLRERDTNGDGTLDQRVYVLQDDNFNVVAQTNTSGAVQKRQAYEAYGQPIFLAPDFTAGSATLLNWHYHFAGYFRDIETALYQVRHRYLHPLLGRWLTRDPLESDDSLYRYVKNSPMNKTDPSGELAVIPIAIVAGAIGQYCICARDRRNWDNQYGARDFTATEKTCVDTAYGYMPWAVKQTVARCIAFHLSMANNLTAPMTMCKSLCFMPPYNYGAKSYLGAADVNCTDCFSILNTIMTLIHECYHQQIHCPLEVETYENAIALFKLVTASCEQMANDGVCKSRAECESFINDIINKEIIQLEIERGK